MRGSLSFSRIWLAKQTFFAFYYLFFLFISFFFVILRRKTKVLQYSAHVEGICPKGWEGYGHIEKGVLALSFGYLESSKFKNYQNIAARMPIGMYFMVRLCVHTYIRRGLQCCLFSSKGNARASDSGTAIVQSRFFVYIFGYN